MKNKIALYAALVAAGIVIGGAGPVLIKEGFSSGGNAEVEVKAGGAGKGDKKVAYWRAPMDPTYVSDKPGKSPMGMDLVPVYEGETAPAGTVLIDPVTVQNIGVRSVKVEEKQLHKTIRTIGRVDYDEKRVFHVHTKVEGWVEKLYVDFTGQEVRKGTTLLDLYSPSLVSAEEEYLLSIKYGEGALKYGEGAGDESFKELSRRRLELWDIPDEQIRELERTGKVKKTLRVVSPSKGVVIKKNVVDGMFVKPGMSLYTIADISRVWVYADVYEYELPWVSVGQEAEMTLASHPGKVFKGEVSFIFPFMEAKTRTNKVRIVFDNPGGLLKPAMYANVTLKAALKKDAVGVPKEAVLLSGDKPVVIVRRGGGKFSPREVTLGVETDDYYEVLSGVRIGEEVVTSAHFLIDSESRLREAIGKMIGGKEGESRPGAETMEEAKNEDTGHEGMDHEGMDHKDMGAGGEHAEEMDHEAMDHEAMVHKEMDAGGEHAEEMDHEAMDHKDMDHHD